MFEFVGECEHQHEAHSEDREQVRREFGYDRAENGNRNLRLGEASARIMHLNTSSVVRDAEIRMRGHCPTDDGKARCLCVVIVAIIPIVDN